MLDLNELITKYTWVTFKEFNKEKQMPEDAFRVPALKDIVGTEKSGKKELEYIWIDYGPKEATDNVIRVLMKMYILGVSESLSKLWQSDKADLPDSDKDAQLDILNAIATQLYSGNSDEAKELRQKCHTEYFRQLILYDRENNMVFATDESSKSAEEMRESVEFLDSLMARLFRELILDINSEETSIVQ